MWFLFGLVTLVLAVVAALKLRARSAWRGIGDSVTVDGQSLRYEHGTRVHKNRVHARLWGVTAPPGYDFRLHPEGWLDRLGRSLGVNAERSVGDRDFDEAIFIESDDERLVAALRGAPALRARILDLQRQLMIAGFSNCTWQAAGGRLWLEASGEADPLPELTAGIVATLDALVRALPATNASSRLRGDPFVRRALLLLALNVGFVVLAIATLLRVMPGRTDLLEPWSLFSAMLVPGLVLGGAYLVVAARWLRNSARAHRVLAEILVLGVPAIVVGGYGLAREANITFDTSAPGWRVVEQASTSHRTYRCGRRNRRTCHEYVLRLPSGIDGEGQPRGLDLDRATFDRLPVQGPVAIDVRPGALGFAWVADVRGG
ncbi:MAG: hypothetical protein LW860_20060 [Xanthomonadaceae bacterium]|jgi:hypothetical protein|nr:hypothetical protein [Xanthomonadaceae bacterium]